MDVREETEDFSSDEDVSGVSASLNDRDSSDSDVEPPSDRELLARGVLPA